jgi:transposase-like protein
MLDNFEHIKAYWIMLTPRVAQIALRFGAERSSTARWWRKRFTTTQEQPRPKTSAEASCYA